MSNEHACFTGSSCTTAGVLALSAAAAAPDVTIYNLLLPPVIWAHANLVAIILVGCAQFAFQNKSEFSGSLEIFICQSLCSWNKYAWKSQVYNITQKVHLNMEQQGTEFLLLGSFITIHKYSVQYVYSLST